jgi:hypothetical protein
LGGEFGCGDVVVSEGLGDDRGGHVQDVLADGAGPADRISQQLLHVSTAKQKT